MAFMFKKSNMKLATLKQISWLYLLIIRLKQQIVTGPEKKLFYLSDGFLLTLSPDLFIND